MAGLEGEYVSLHGVILFGSGRRVKFFFGFL